MSTIASPRPSSPAASQPDSLSTEVSNTPARNGSTTAERAALRRNRAALRDYYNLKTTNPAPNDSQDALSITSTIATDQEEPTENPEFDAEGFSPQDFATKLLASEGLEGVLRVEARLISEIRTFDGEKKALVYDNYSKLIAATDTIRLLREKMDPLTPATETLVPRIEEIATRAGQLAVELREAHERVGPGRDAKARQKELVKWVLDAPSRLTRLRESEDEQAAQQQWSEVSALLAQWAGTRGVEQVRQACEKAMIVQKTG